MTPRTIRPNVLTMVLAAIVLLPALPLLILGLRAFEQNVIGTHAVSWAVHSVGVDGLPDALYRWLVGS
jgi:hypothetical protein